MKALTYTIITGSRACPNDCPICISKMTPDHGIGMENIDADELDFRRAANLALNHNPENILLTGKGEPTLYPGKITQYLAWLSDVSRSRNCHFDRIELQTGGSLLAKGGLYDQFLDGWRAQGLCTIALSIYHYEKDMNKKAFRPGDGEYFNLPALIKKLQSKGYRVRLSCVMLKDYIDDIKKVDELIEFSRDCNVFQLTLRMADRPDVSLDKDTADFIDRNRLSDKQLSDIIRHVESEGSFCYTLPHGAGVYELHGQNVCITTGLTPAKRDSEEIRQMIFFPQGWLTTSWENVQGGRLL